MRQRNRPTTPARYRSTGSTRNLPLKYAKRNNESYKAAMNASKPPEPTRLRNVASALWRFTRKAFQATTRLVISSPLDKKIQNRIHQGNRWSDEF